MSTVPLTVGISLHRVHHAWNDCRSLPPWWQPSPHSTQCCILHCEGEPATLLVVIPILTVPGHHWRCGRSTGFIRPWRRHGGVADNAAAEWPQYLAVQGVFLALGLLVLKRQKYCELIFAVKPILRGPTRLFVRNVALSVMLWQFGSTRPRWVRDIIAQSSGIAYWSLTLAGDPARLR